MNWIGQEIENYVRELQAFVAEHDLPSTWFEVIDHGAFKFRDTSDFEDGIEDFRHMADEITSINMNNRRLATARLHMSIMIGKFGSVKWIELMEPRPEKAGNDFVGFEHVEFFYPNFTEIQDFLDSKGIPYQMETNTGHNWVNIVINGAGQELKLNDRTLGDMIGHELETGISNVI
jgi:predicted metalloenzyme YecM